ncbi:hypothetical protein SKA53_01536 [Yoonia vestfoldensis SKA53]|jgi:hypothetical protein|uniref:Uncharacterized protein n=1 Tax=Yoonia vestfoldensis SKA53 TaxID=314232 RepID=A3V3I0_9RHOB|nr:hypothetical protein SKA53_01536 [Yoonia vestfoldensis SKA53]
MIRDHKGGRRLVSMQIPACEKLAMTFPFLMNGVVYIVMLDMYWRTRYK